MVSVDTETWQGHAYELARELDAARVDRQQARNLLRAADKLLRQVEPFTMPDTWQRDTGSWRHRMERWLI